MTCPVAELGVYAEDHGGQSLEGQHHEGDIRYVEHGDEKHDGEGVAGLVTILFAYFFNKRKADHHGGGHGKHGGKDTHGRRKHEYQHIGTAPHNGQTDDFARHPFGDACRVDDAGHHAEEQDEQHG